VEQPNAHSADEALAADGAVRLRTTLLALLVALLAAAPFTRSLGYPFLAWDDDVNFFSVDHVRSLDVASLKWMWTSFHAGHYAPLTWMSCALDFRLAPDDAAAQLHRTNLLLHGATAGILFLALVRLLQLGSCRGSEPRVRIIAALSALAWAVHPLRVESVAWLTERRDVLSGAFYALTLAAWLQAKRDERRRSLWTTLSVLAFAAGLLSKVSGVGLPLVMLAVEAWPLSERRSASWSTLFFRKLPYFALSAAACMIAVLGQRSSTQVLASVDELGLLARLGVAAHALVFYLGKTVAPFGLSPLYELPQRVSLGQPRFALATLAALALFGGIRFALPRTNVRAALWTTLIAFALLLAPVSGLVHAGRQLAADRYSYLPSFALAGLVAGALFCFDSRPLRWIAAAGVLALGAASWRQTGFWSDTRTLFRRAVEVEPNGYWANHKLGVLLNQEGEPRAALDFYDRAIAARPERGADAYFDRAVSLLSLGERERARADLETALRIDPKHAGALDVLSSVDREDGRFEAAVERLLAAVKAEPENTALLEALARTLLDAEENEGALEVATHLRELAPQSASGHRLAGMALLYLGRFAEAEQALTRAAAIEPSAPSLYNLAVAIERQGRAADARAAYERLLELHPDNARARAALEKPAQR